jgi:hypothetical protein
MLNPLLQGHDCYLLLDIVLVDIRLSLQDAIGLDDLLDVAINLVQTMQAALIDQELLRALREGSVDLPHAVLQLSVLFGSRSLVVCALGKSRNI